MGHKSHSIVWFFILYVSAYYYQHFGAPTYGWQTFLGSFLLMFLLTMIEPYLSHLENLELLDYNALLSWAATYSRFATFQGMRARWLRRKSVGKIVGALSRATFVVYILQEHDAIRSALWNSVNIMQYVNAPVHKLAMLPFFVFRVLLLISIGINAIYVFARSVYLNRIADLAERWILRFVNCWK